MKITDLKQCNFSCIYSITFPNGMKYVGKAINLSKRAELYKKKYEYRDYGCSPCIQALCEYGLENVEFDILSRLSCKKDDDLSIALSILEIKYIRELNSLQPNGYNIQNGGEILEIPTEYIATPSGYKCKKYRTKPVLAYNIDGSFYKEFDNIEQCAYLMGCSPELVDSCLDKRKSLLGEKYMLRRKKYNIVPERILPFKPIVIEKTVKKIIYDENIIIRDKIVHRNGIPVLQYSLDGDFVKRHESKISAAEYMGVSCIGNGKVIKGFFFIEQKGQDIEQKISPIEILKKKPKYNIDAKKDIDINEYIELSSNTHEWSNLINDFKVAQYNLDGVLIDIFDSIKHASKETGVPYPGIWACVFGRTKKSKGFIWRKM